MISFKCAACGAKMTVNDELSRKKVMCPKCSAKMAVPDAGPIAQAPKTIVAHSPMRAMKTESKPTAGSKPIPDEEPFATPQPKQAAKVKAPPESVDDFSFGDEPATEAPRIKAAKVKAPPEPEPDPEDGGFSFDDAPAPAKSTKQTVPKPTKSRTFDAKKPSFLERLTQSPLMLACLGGGFLLLLFGGVGAYFLFQSAPAPLAVVVNSKKGKEEPGKKNNVVDNAVSAKPGKVGGKDKKPKFVEPIEEEKPVVVAPDPALSQPVPASIAHDTIQKVKRSTIFIKVNFADGRSASGTGFMAVEPGLIITNAHVVGMKHTMTEPEEVTAVIQSGEPDERSVKANVLGVDRENDLAVLSMAGDERLAPPMLPVSDQLCVTELQKVYVFGFPYGEQIGKNITVSESSVSSLRKTADGLMEQIQVNGGMNPGNSGGPVVDARGVICGVAVAGIPGTNINFAVPSEKVQRLIGGRVYDLNLGAAYRSEGVLKIQAKMSLHDPLKRLKSIRLDVWSGSSAARPTKQGPPVRMVGDSPVKSVEVVRDLLEASTDFALPPLDGGKVLWTALAATDDRGQTHWQPAIYFEVPTGAPYDRVPTTLALKRTDAQRTLKVAAKQKLEFSQGKQKASYEKTLEVDVLETIKMSGEQAQVRMDIGNIQSAIAEVAVSGEKKARPENPRTTTALKSAAFQFTLNNTGTLTRRMVPTPSPALSMNERHDMDDMINALQIAFEVGFLQVPERRMEANDSWTARMPMLFSITGSSRQIPAVMVMQCLYEGQRKQGGSTEAYVRLIGTMESGAFISGTVRGHALIDVGGGFISKMHAKLHVDFDQGNSYFSSTADVDITRTPGNTKGITPGATIVAGKELARTASELAASDPIDDKYKGHAKFLEVEMEAGKTYIIEMRAPAKSVVDPYLRLEDPNGKEVAEDDDSGGGIKGLDARIVYRAVETGKHKIVATSRQPDQIGDFQLIVTEYAEAKRKKE